MVGNRQFTLHELRLMARMCAIAEANIWGEGDYQNWKETSRRAFNNLWAKITDGIPQAQFEKEESI